MHLSSILALLAFVLSATSLTILLPLYQYPGTSASAWVNVTAAIAAYPKVQWQVIINPNSGPGTIGSSPSDDNYITGISELNSYPNVITLGYVDTDYAKRAYSDVITDVATYANWSSYPGANISVGGIFFDDVVTASSAPTRNVITYYRNISAYAYANVPSDVTPVVFNPGALGPSQLFSFCDSMVEFESPVSAYKGDATIKTFPQGNVGQSSIIIYNATDTTDVKGLVGVMLKDGVGQVYVDYGVCAYKDGLTGCYNQLYLTQLKRLTSAVAAG